MHSLCITITVHRPPVVLVRSLWNMEAVDPGIILPLTPADAIARLLPIAANKLCVLDRVLNLEDFV